ncbi:hypothetical protein Droror1_Dr00005988 [Drosera rotundifolia]
MEFRHLSLSNSMRVQPIEETTPPREMLNMESAMEGVVVKAWGIICLSIAFTWQLYTNWLLVQLHESSSGARYSRYLQLAIVSFGPRLGKGLCLFPVLYLSGGTCTTFIITTGSIIKKLLEIVCDDGTRCNPNALSATELYLIFVCVAIMIARLPNFNSVAWISLIGVVTAIVYTSLIWTVPLTKDRPIHISYTKSEEMESDAGQAMGIVGALGIITLAFRGHNLVVEIEGTLPSSSMRPSSKTMWRAVTTSYTIIALCLFSIAIGGFWAYGTLIPTRGMLDALVDFHGHRSFKPLLCIIYIMIIINILFCFSLYAMPVFDNLELQATTIRKAPCPWWLRTLLRLFFGCITFFISVAFPFLPELSAQLGGMTMPLAYVYPCFMWIAMRRSKRHGSTWWISLILGCLGACVSVLVVASAIWDLVKNGLHANFFHSNTLRLCLIWRYGSRIGYDIRSGSISHV